MKTRPYIPDPRPQFDPERYEANVAALVQQIDDYLAAASCPEDEREGLRGARVTLLEGLGRARRS